MALISMNSSAEVPAVYFYRVRDCALYTKLPNLVQIAAGKIISLKC